MSKSFWRKTAGTRTVSRDGRIVIVKDFNNYFAKVDGKWITKDGLLLAFPTLKAAKNWCYFK